MQQETAARQQFSYPPFTRIIRVSFRHKIREIVQDAASLFALHLHKDFGNYLTGPGEPVIARIQESIYHGADVKTAKKCWYNCIC